MTDRLDLLKIAQEEQSGDVFKYLDSVLKRSKVQPRGISDAVIWEGGSTHGGPSGVTQIGSRTHGGLLASRMAAILRNGCT